MAPLRLADLDQLTAFETRGSLAAEVTLYTSLPPRMVRLSRGDDIGQDYQKKCISSWRRFGFKVVSLNSRAEIESLSSQGYEVDFLQTESAPPKIEDFINAIRNSPAQVAAIVNADCIILADQDMMHILLEAAESGLVLGQRIEIEQDKFYVQGVKTPGFDLFVFNTAHIQNLELDDTLKIGTPWWDYWFPIAYHRAGGKLMSLLCPIVVHLDHPVAYSQENWLFYAQKLYHFTKNSYKWQNYCASKDMTETVADSFSRACYKWIIDTAQKIELLTLSSRLLLILLLNIDEMEDASNYRKKLATAQSKPIQNLRRFLKWKSSQYLARFGSVVSKKFAARMRRRTEKNSPYQPLVKMYQRSSNGLLPESPAGQKSAA